MMRHVLGSRASIGGVLGSGRGGAGGNGLLTGLVAYWGLDEASGNALDKHSGGLTLTANNAPGTDTGKVYATSRTFSAASNQYFSRASEAATQTGDINFAVAAWVYISTIPSASEYPGIITKDIAGAREFHLLLNGDSKRFNFTLPGLGLAVATTYGEPPTGQWIFVAGWHDTTADTVNISVNNGAVDSAARTGTPTTTAAPLEIGRDYATQTRILKGRLGPVAYWKNRILSADDRAALWNGGAGLAYSAFS